MPNRVHMRPASLKSYHRLLGAGTALMLALSLGALTASAATGIQTVDSGGSWYNRMVLDASGFPVIAYYRSTSGDLMLAHCNDAACAGGDESIQVVDSAGTVGISPSLVLNSLGYPVISYQDEGEGDLKLARCNDPNCDPSVNGPEMVRVIDEAISEFAPVGRGSSLALDSAGNPVISYSGVAGRLMLAHCDDPNCDPSVNDSESIVIIRDADTRSLDTQMILDADGLPIILLSEPNDGALELVYCNDPNCDEWENGEEPIETVAPGVGSAFSMAMALDGNSYPVIGYYRGYDGLKLVHCNDPACAGGDETHHTVDPLLIYAGGTPVGISLVLDANGYPVMSYQRMLSGQGSLMVAHCNDVDCADGDDPLHMLDDMGYGDNVGGHSALALNASGNPVVAYTSSSSEYGSELRLAVCSDAVCTGYYTLTMGGDMNGSGTMVDAANGINCAWDGLSVIGTCANTAVNGTSYAIVAIPSFGSSFSSWSFCDSVTTTNVAEDTCLITPAHIRRNVLAAFKLNQYQLTVSGAGPGRGAMTDVATSINCTWTGSGSSGACRRTSDYGTSYSIVATPSTGSTFVAWTGCASTSTTNIPGDTCNITPSINAAVSAGFSLNSYTLSTAASGPGRGTMTDSVRGLGCAWNGSAYSGSCQNTGPYGTFYSIIAQPSTGSTFGGWSGCTQTTTTYLTGDTCRITPASNTSVIATFDLRNNTLVIYGFGAANGTMTDTANGLSCAWNGAATSGVCSKIAPTGTNYAIIAQASPGSAFGWWWGCESTGTTFVEGDTCYTSPVAATGVTAAFIYRSLSAYMVCQGPDLGVTIQNGDGPFNLTGTGPGLPASGLPIGTTLLHPLGSNYWEGVTLAETSGDFETRTLGDISCGQAAPPPTPAPRSPKNGAAVYTHTPRLTWKAVKGAKQYYIKLDNVTDPENVITIADQDIPTGYFIAPSLPFGTYSWQVSVKDATGWSEYSLPFSFDVTLNKTPKKNAATTDRTPKFTWQKVKGATLPYRLRLWDDQGCGVSQVFERAANKPTYTTPPADTLALGSYFWQVTSDNWATATPCWPFDVTTLKTPRFESAVSTLLPKFTWLKNKQASAYHLQVSAVSSFVTTSIDNAALTGTSYKAAPADGLDFGRYFWRIQENVGGFGPYTPNGVFFITNMTAPKNTLFTLKGKVTFKWKKVSGATGYFLEVSEVPNDFSSPVFTKTTTALKATSPTLPRGMYYWRVTVQGINKTMPVWVFTIGP